MKKINELFKPVNLTKGSVWKVIAGFSVPILISYLFQQIYTIADAAICGKFLSENQVAGVNNTGTIVFLVLQFAFGCTAGFSVITSKHSGQKNIGAIRRSLATQIVLSFMIGVILTTVSILSINPLLKGIGLQASANPVQNEIYRSAYVYVYIIFAGCLAQIFYNLSASFLRSVGDSFAPLIFLIVSAVLNIALDLLFIAVFHTGVAGAAIATIISQAISAIGCFVYTFARYKEYRLTKADFRIEKIPVINHLKLGLPLAFQFSILCIGLIVMQAVIVKFDTSADGVVISAAAQNGFGAATKLNNFLMCPFNALGTAMLSYCGQNYGAGNTERVKKGVKDALLIAFIVYIVCAGGGLLLTIGGTYMKIFYSDEKISAEAIRYGNAYLYCDLSLYYLLGVLFVLRNSLQGIEKSLFPLVAGVGELIARTVLCMLLPAALNHGPIDINAGTSALLGLTFADPLAWAAACAVLLFGTFKYIFKAKQNKRPHM